MTPEERIAQYVVVFLALARVAFAVAYVLLSILGKLPPELSWGNESLLAGTMMLVVFGVGCWAIWDMVKAVHSPRH